MRGTHNTADGNKSSHFHFQIYPVIWDNYRHKGNPVISQAIGQVARFQRDENWSSPLHSTPPWTWELGVAYSYCGLQNQWLFISKVLSLFLLLDVDSRLSSVSLLLTTFFRSRFIFCAGMSVVTLHLHSIHQYSLSLGICII